MADFDIKDLLFQTVAVASEPEADDVPAVPAAKLTPYYGVKLVDIGLAARTAGHVRLPVTASAEITARADQIVASMKEDLELDDLAEGATIKIDLPVARIAMNRKYPCDFSVRIDTRDTKQRLFGMRVKLDEPITKYVACVDAELAHAGKLTLIGGKLYAGGAPVTAEHDYALLQITNVGLGELGDLEDERDKLLAAYTTRDHDLIDSVYRSVRATVLKHPVLLDGDRRALLHGLHTERESMRTRVGLNMTPQRVPYAAFVGKLRYPGISYVTPGVYVEEAGGDDPPALYWNTRILEGERVLDDLEVAVGHRYAVETSIDPTTLEGWFGPDEPLGVALDDGEPITIVATCRTPVLFADPADISGPPQTRVEHVSKYEAAHLSCPAVRFGLVPDKAPLTITLTLRTRNTARASHSLRLAKTPANEASRPMSMPTLVARAADISIEVTDGGDVVVGAGIVREDPLPLAAGDDLAMAVMRARKALVKLSKDYRPDPARGPFGLVDGPGFCLRMAEIGADLHRDLFGPHDRTNSADRARIAGHIARGGGGEQRMQVGNRYHPIPWAVMYDGAYRDRPLDGAASLDLDCFWGHRYRIDRMIVGHFEQRRSAIERSPVRVQSCVNPDLDAEQGVHVVDDQRKLFDGIPDVVAAPVIETAPAFVDYVKTQAATAGACDLLYLFCHARVTQTRDDLYTSRGKAPDDTRLVFGNGAVDVKTMARRIDPLANQPLVFLNACGSAANDESFQSPLLVHFLDRWLAAGVIGTDWEVPTVFADAFGRAVVGYFLRDRMTIGDAIARASREAFAQHNPFPLVYALYAPPQFTAAATGARS